MANPKGNCPLPLSQCPHYHLNFPADPKCCLCPTSPFSGPAAPGCRATLEDRRLVHSIPSDSTGGHLLFGMWSGCGPKVPERSSGGKTKSPAPAPSPSITGRSLVPNINLLAFNFRSWVGAELWVSPGIWGQIGLCQVSLGEDSWPGTRGSVPLYPSQSRRSSDSVQMSWRVVRGARISPHPGETGGRPRGPPEARSWHSCFCVWRAASCSGSWRVSPPSSGPPLAAAGTRGHCATGSCRGLSVAVAGGRTALRLSLKSLLQGEAQGPVRWAVAGTRDHSSKMKTNKDI